MAHKSRALTKSLIIHNFIQFGNSNSENSLLLFNRRIISVAHVPVINKVLYTKNIFILKFKHLKLNLCKLSTVFLLLYTRIQQAVGKM